MHRQDHHPHLGLALAHPGRRLEPGNPFHGDVHQDDIGALALRELERLFAACRFAYHLDVVHRDRKSTRLNSSHGYISYAVFCLKKKKTKTEYNTSNSETHIVE